MNDFPEKDDLEFEIQFYEGLLKKKPDFIEAMSTLGDLYTKKGFYKKGLVLDEKLSLFKPEDPIVLYNLACSYSLLQETDKALRTIKRAINCGYDNFDYLEHDDDLTHLRNDIRFKKYFSRVRKRKKPLS